MSHFEVATTEVDDATSEGPQGGSAQELAAMLDPTATQRVLDTSDPDDWCAFGEA